MNKKKQNWIFVLAIIIVLVTAPVAFASDFSDMPEDWSTTALENAVVNGLLIGNNGLILPGNNLTRAEMATIVNRAFGATEKASLSGYSDVPSERWYAEEMAKAVKMKTFLGSGGQLFPDNPITREEAFVVLARALKLYGESESALDGFADRGQISWWAKDGISSLAANGYVAGSFGNVSPKKFITRAEFSQVMDNLIGSYIRASGTISTNMNKNVMINVSGVTLKDLTIAGDLIIGEGVGDGEITLSAVTVEGRIVIRSKAGSVSMIESPVEAAAQIEDYFAVKNNVRYEYEGMGNEFAYFNVFNQYTSDLKVQQRVNNGGTVMARVMELKDDRIERVLSKGEVYYRENFLNKSEGDPEILLLEPLIAGTSWTIANGATRTIESTNTVLDTPYGSYVCIMVKTEYADDTVLDYYAKDIGLVKTVFLMGEEEISSTLKEIYVNMSQTELIPFYYPNINDGKYYYEYKVVAFNTNDVTGDVLAEAYKQMPQTIPLGVDKVFSGNTRINSITLNTGNQVEIDLNAAFVTEMNAGALYESMILQAVANTFGQYYNAQEVVLTIEQQPYSSGHIMMEAGEAIPVNLDNIFQLVR